MLFIFSIVLSIALLALAWDCCRTHLQQAQRPHWIALGAIATAALVIRLIYLSQSSLDHLEATYLFEAIKPEGLWEVITSRQAAEQMHQPLYTLLLRGWATVSTDEGFLRLPSTIFSVACIPLAFCLIRNDASRKAGLWTAALTAASPLLIWYGRDCTPYALLAMLSLAAMVSAQQTLESPSRWGAVRTALCLALAFYTHFHGGWIAITVILWLALQKDRRRILWETTAVTALFTLPWVPALFDKLATSVEGLSEDSMLMRYSHEPLEATSEAFRVLLGSPSPFWILVLVLVAVGIIALIRQESRLGVLIAIALGIGLLAEAHILWQLNRSKGIVYVDVRHYIYLVPLLAAAVVSVPVRGPVPFFRPAAVATLGLHLWMVWPMVTSLEKPDVRSAVAYVQSHAAPDQGIGFLPAPWYQPIVEHYLFGSCPKLIHARSHEGWWRLDTCEPLERPEENTIFGFPPTPERLHQSAQRRELTRLWVIDIRDHRFGLAVPPTDPQERFLCWDCREQARLQNPIFFGKWVVVEVFDARQLQECASPPKSNETKTSRSVTSAEAWQLECRIL
jgi:uncharacterized membrane protein (UPF0136 family)